jgi:hypothetical protein
MRMMAAQVWTLIGLLATALFTLLIQLRTVEQRISDRLASVETHLHANTSQVHRGFGELRGDIAVLRARIDRDGP